MNVDDSDMVAAIAEVTEVREEPQPDWEALTSSDNVGLTWFMRGQDARMVHLGHLREHRVHDELDLPQGVKPLSIRLVDKDDYHTAKARGYEQESTGQENFNSATLQPATLRLLLVVAQALGLAVAVATSLKPSFKLPFSRRAKYGHTTTGRGSETRTSLAVTQDPAASERKVCCLGPPLNESQRRALGIGPERARSLCTQQCA